MLEVLDVLANSLPSMCLNADCLICSSRVMKLGHFVVPSIFLLGTLFHSCYSTDLSKFSKMSALEITLTPKCCRALILQQGSQFLTRQREIRQQGYSEVAGRRYWFRAKKSLPDTFLWQRKHSRHAETKMARKERWGALPAEVRNGAKFLKHGLITESLALSSQMISARLCGFEYM